MNTRTLIAAGVAVLATAAPATASGTYEQVHVGASRWHVQHLLCSTGHRVVMYADENGERHLIKTYAHGTITITYVGPPRHKPYAGPYEVESKERT